MKQLQNLYNNTLKYNCSYYEIKPKYKSDLIIMFLGTSDFIIVNNYYGCVAYGKRLFDYEGQTAIYTYKNKCQSIGSSSIAQLIKHYELKRLKNKNKYAIKIEVSSND